MKGFQGLSPKTATSLQIAVVIAITFAVYSNILFNGFVIDDSFQVTGNRWIRDVRYLPEIFSSNFVLGGRTAFYRPLVHVFYMISYQFFGLAPWGFHLMSIMFHAGVSVLVFLTISRLLRGSEEGGGIPPLPSPHFDKGGMGGLLSPPFMAALLFAVHPIHTEAVAWTSVTDPFLAFFYLLSFYLYIRSADNGALSGAAYLFSVFSLFLAMLCKEPALTLPVILVAYDCLFRKEGVRLSYYIKRYIPYLVAAGVYFALRLHALGGVVTFRTSMELSPYQYAVDVVVLFRESIEKLFLPVDLNVWHVFQPPDTFFSFTGIVSLLVTAGFFVIAFIAIRKSRVAFLGFLFIVVPLFPAFYLPGLTQGLENAFTERYLYLPSFGFVMLIALLIARARERRPEWAAALVIAFSVTIVLYSIGTVTRNTVWKDNFTLWSDAARKSPNSSVPRNGYGDSLRERGRPDEAIEQYLIALRLDPRNPFTHASLGLAYADKGWTGKALEQFQTALSLNPRSAETHDFLGVLYGSVGRHDKAIREFGIALSLNPELDYVYKHLGIAYSNLGLMDKAIEYFQTAVRMNPDDADAHNNLGIAYSNRGLMDEAMQHLEAAVRLKPDDPDFHYNVARAYKGMGLAAKAEEHFRRAESLGRGQP